ncbi:MAG: metalloregulator ArsR/SmtB family transcription factor [Gemmatimonadaceae bacterium]
MGKKSMSPQLLAMVADRFKALAEPARLQILSQLREREMTVSEIVDATSMGQANVSKHLALLLSLGFVERRKDGLYAYYGIADSRVFQLCDLMCARIESDLTTRRKALAR